MIPLTSAKKERKSNQNEIDLGNEFYEHVQNKMEATSRTLNIYNLYQGKLLEELELFEQEFNISVNEFFPPRKDRKSIVTIYNQLEPPRQKYVYDVAEQQLEEQSNVVKFPESKKIIRGRQTAAGSALYSDDYGTHTEVLSASMVPRGADELVEVVGKSM